MLIIFNSEYFFNDRIYVLLFLFNAKLFLLILLVIILFILLFLFNKKILKKFINTSINIKKISQVSIYIQLGIKDLLILNLGKKFLQS